MINEAPDDTSKEKSIKFSIVLPLRAAYFHILQYETPCTTSPDVGIQNFGGMDWVNNIK